MNNIPCQKVLHIDHKKSLRDKNGNPIYEDSWISESMKCLTCDKKSKIGDIFLRIIDRKNGEEFLWKCCSIICYKLHKLKE